MPAFPFARESCKYARRFKSSSTTCSYTLQEYSKQTYYREVLAQAVQGLDNVKLIIPDRFFCDASHCSMTCGDKLPCRDINHLNLDGSSHMATMLAQQAGFALPLPSYTMAPRPPADRRTRT